MNIAIQWEPEAKNPTNTTQTEIMDNFRCAGYVFNSKFDSGNLAQVVLVNIYPGKREQCVHERE